VPFALNPALDPAGAAEHFARQGRVQVRDVLDAESADRLSECLLRKVPWSFTYYDDQGAAVIEHANLSKLSPQDMQSLQRRVFNHATGGFGYAYGLYHMDASARPTTDACAPIHEFFEFLQSPQMMDLVRTVIGDQTPVMVDAQATQFGPGNFLSYHNDLMPKANRRCAYVFNITRNWRPDWGGYLQFFDERGNGSDAFMPNFNALNLFRVPQPHAVTYVPPFARGVRQAVSGWYRGPVLDEATAGAKP
jgi:Rps23 Pro-64 3,4-dihydroxylase Tpa1-like proline 4-hydroxylase